MTDQKPLDSDRISEFPLSSTTITDPALVLLLLHETKRIIINLLCRSALNIQQLKEATNINPGTIKRHLTDLENAGLVMVAEERLNEYNIKMKFYRATAMEFKIEITLPDGS